MEKERIITAPEECEIEKVEIVDGAAVVTFKEKERKLPKTWEEFCDMFPAKAGEVTITGTSEFSTVTNERMRIKCADRNLLPDHATAEAVLALCQLIQLRNCYNGDWVPDWEDNDEDKYMIYYYKNRCCEDVYQNTVVSPLYFKTQALRDEFLRCFRPLIEKLKPLYGIKEGGEE